MIKYILMITAIAAYLYVNYVRLKPPGESSITRIHYEDDFECFYYNGALSCAKNPPVLEAPTAPVQEDVPIKQMCPLKECT